MLKSLYHISLMGACSLILSLISCQNPTVPPSSPASAPVQEVLPGSLPQSGPSQSGKPAMGSQVPGTQGLQTEFTGLKESAIAVGETLHIQGKNISAQGQYQVRVETEPGESRVAAVNVVSADEMAVSIPWLDTAERSSVLKVSLFEGERNLKQFQVSLKKVSLSSVQHQLRNELENLKGLSQESLSATAPVSGAVEIMHQTLQTGENSPQTFREIDYVLAGTIDSAASLELVLQTLESYQQKYSFKTAAQLFDATDQLVLANPIQRSKLDPNTFKEPNQLPACLSSQDTLSKDLVVLYINGINTRSDQFCNTKQRIATMVSDLGITADVSGVYQHSLREDIENNPQKIEERKQACENLKDQTNRRIRIATAGKGVATFNFSLTAGVAFEYADKQVNCSTFTPAGADTLREAVGQRLVNYDPAQVAEISNIVSRLLQRNKRIILMPHSQGNFFARQALERLLREAEKPGNIFSKEQIVNSVGVIWMASPVEIQRIQAPARPLTGPGSVLVNPESELAAQKAAYALVCNANLQEPTCFSTHVGIRQDVVAHLRYLENWHVFHLLGSLGKNVQIHPDYVDEYQTSTFEAPIQIDAFELPGVNGGAAGMLNLGLKAHDVDCSYLYDPNTSNPLDYCRQRDDIKPVASTGPTPRKKIEEALLSISKNLHYPLGEPNLDTPSQPDAPVILDKVEDAAYPDNYGISGKWRGRYVDGSQSSGFDMYLTMDKNNQVLGMIMDDPLTGVGKAWVEGTFANNTLTFVKRYFQGGTHSVNYSGVLSDSKTRIEGNWNIGAQTKGAWDADKQPSSGKTSLVGKWEGVMFEAKGTSVKYPVSFEISQLAENKTCGKWAFPTLGCGGALLCQKAGAEANTYVIDGLIEYGQSRCKEGSNRFVLKGSDTVYRATFQATSPDAIVADGYLRRID